MDLDFPKYAPAKPGQDSVGNSIPTGPRLVMSLARKWIPVVPVAEREGAEDSCDGCIGNDEDPGKYVVHCRSLPNCSDVIYVHPTPENMTDYVAWRLSHGS